MPAAIQVRVPLKAFASFLHKAVLADRRHPQLKQLDWVASHFEIDNQQATYIPNGEREWSAVLRLRVHARPLFLSSVVYLTDSAAPVVLKVGDPFTPNKGVPHETAD
jgi:hypothetical protein